MIGFDEATMAMVRSAEATTVVVAVAMLGSPPEATRGVRLTFGMTCGVVALAVSDKTVPPGVDPATFTTSVKTALLSGNVRMVHDIDPAAPTDGVEHVQPAAAVKDTKVVPAGSV
jgi:hypothetical protein